MRYYPVSLNLDKERVLLAGGGKVAERKALTLLNAGANLIIISPTLTQKLKRLAKSGKLGWQERKVRKSDLGQALIVIAATDDNAANKNLSKWAKELGIPVNVVDNPALSDFISPAFFYKGKAIVSVYTDARDPVLSRDLKNFLKDNWDEFLSYRDRL